MADEPTTTSRLGTWIKSAITGIFGLCSGAVLMYVTPLVDAVVKPGKPTANFGYEVEGQNVTFQNRSVSGHEGWWDFGDGSALEPYNPDQPKLVHAYTKPGSYNVKLSLRNLFGAEDDRTVQIQLDGGQAKGPQIDVFDVKPLQPESYAPATFRVTGKCSGANLGIWASSSDQPIDMVCEPPASFERYFTFQEPGKHVIRLAVAQGKNLVERSANVLVQAPHAGMLMAVVQVSYDAERVDKGEKRHNIKVAWPAKYEGATYPFSVPLLAERGQAFTTAKLAQAVDARKVKDARIELNKERTEAKLTGELLKEAKQTGWVGEVIVEQERRWTPLARPPQTVSMQLAVPGSTLLPLPKLPQGWVSKSRALKLSILDGSQTLAKLTSVPGNVTVPLRAGFYRIIASEAGDGLRVDVSAGKVGLLPLSN